MRKRTRSVLVIAVVILGFCAFGSGLGAVFGIKAVRNGDLFFAHNNANDAIKAFNGAGLRTAAIKPIPANAGGWGLDANKGKSFSPGVFPAVTFYVFEFGSASDRNDVQDKLVYIQRNYGSIIRPSFYVKDNLIFVYSASNAVLAARYETVLAGMR